MFQPKIGNQSNTTKSQPKTGYHGNNILRSKVVGTINYKLDAYTLQSQFNLDQNIKVIIFLYNLDTKVLISDSVIITTPLSSQLIQITTFPYEVTLQKENFIDGLNQITVSYKDQKVSFQILRKNTITYQNQWTPFFTIHDILNTRPAPGVKDYFNFSMSNPSQFDLPTQQGEFIEILLNYNSKTLVLMNKFYLENNFIINEQINFTIPSFLQPLNTYTIQLSFSGDSFLTPLTKNFLFTIHDYTPEITTNLSDLIIGTTNVLNDSTSFMNIKIEGYLPTDLQAKLSLYDTTNVYTLSIQKIQSYRDLLKIAIVNSVAVGIYTLEVEFSYSNGKITQKVDYSIEVVNKIDLIIRTDTTIFTLGNPVLFDFFCYDPSTFQATGCDVTMKEGQNAIFKETSNTGHFQKSLYFSGLDTSIVHNYVFDVVPIVTNLYEHAIVKSYRFYHNTTITYDLQKNIIDKTQLISLTADTEGKFILKNEADIIIASYIYTQKDTTTNYYLDLNSAHRGLNTIKIEFYPDQTNFANVSKLVDIFVYEKITIQKVQTNASFFQLGTFILFKGVATLGTDSDSLNNVKVSLLLNDVIIANTTIQTNDFIFIVPTPTDIGLKKYKVAIYQDDSKFVVNSDLYELTLSVINNFGLLFTNTTYQVDDSIKIGIYGQEKKSYELSYTLNGEKTVVSQFIYNKTFSYDLTFNKFGHYLIYLKEKSTSDQTYYAVEILQNPQITIQYGILKTYTNNTLNVTINNYNGKVQLKLDNSQTASNSHMINTNGHLQIFFTTFRPGNHSVTVLLDNPYTQDKVRTLYFVVYQNIAIQSFTYNNENQIISEEDNLAMHLVFKEFSNQSINDIPIQIVTNENTILAQANIFNSESDLQVTVIGTALSLEIKEVKSLFVHEQVIPLNLTVYKIITSDLKGNYSFTNSVNLKITFSEKYFPTRTPFSIKYQFEGVSNDVNSRNITLKINKNGDYELQIHVEGYHYINQTFTSQVTLKKLFDISNTNLITVAALVVSVPTVIVGISLMKKRKTNI